MAASAIFRLAAGLRLQVDVSPDDVWLSVLPAIRSGDAPAVRAHCRPREVRVCGTGLWFGHTRVEIDPERTAVILPWLIGAGIHPNESPSSDLLAREVRAW